MHDYSGIYSSCFTIIKKTFHWELKVGTSFKVHYIIMPEKHCISILLKITAWQTKNVSSQKSTFSRKELCNISCVASQQCKNASSIWNFMALNNCPVRYDYHSSDLPYVFDHLIIFKNKIWYIVTKPLENINIQVLKPI